MTAPQAAWEVVTDLHGTERLVVYGVSPPELPLQQMSEPSAEPATEQPA
jgi:hypothetical protein